MQPYRYLPTLGKQLVGWKIGLSAAATVLDIIALAAWVSQLHDVPGSAVITASLALRSAASVSSNLIPKLQDFVARPYIAENATSG